MDLRIVAAAVGVMAAPLGAAQFVTVADDIDTSWVVAGSGGQWAAVDFYGTLYYFDGATRHDVPTGLGDLGYITLTGSGLNARVSFEDGDTNTLHQYNGSVVTNHGSVGRSGHDVNANGQIATRGAGSVLRAEVTSPVEGSQASFITEPFVGATPLHRPYVTPSGTVYFVHDNGTANEIRSVWAPVGGDNSSKSPAQTRNLVSGETPDILLGANDSSVLFSTDSSVFLDDGFESISLSDNHARYGALTPAGRAAVIDDGGTLSYWNGSVKSTLNLADIEAYPGLSIDAAPMINDSGADLVVFQAVDENALFGLYAWDTQSNSVSLIIGDSEPIQLDGAEAWIAVLYSHVDFGLNNDLFSDDNSIVLPILDFDSGLVKIVSTQVPEPSMLGLVAGIGFLMTRRRRS